MTEAAACPGSGASGKTSGGLCNTWDNADLAERLGRIMTDIHARCLADAPSRGRYVDY